MQIYALFDEAEQPKGFYTPLVHQQVPAGAVQISVQDWHEFIRHKGLRRWDEEKVVEYLPAVCTRPNKFRLMSRLFLLSRLLSEKVIIITDQYNNTSPAPTGWGGRPPTKHASGLALPLRLLANRHRPIYTPRSGPATRTIPHSYKSES